MSNGQATSQEQGERTVTIYVNTRPKQWTERTITFDQVVSLAYDGNPPSGSDWIFTITYRKGEDSKKEGSMVEGDLVRVKDGMVFNVTPTNRS